jgi:membrane protein implicated in regulation of membrane protease activity
MAPMLDVRLPIGALCTMIGVLLIGYGLSAHSAGGRSLAIDVWWGAVMLGFGALMLAGAWWHRRRGSGRRVSGPQNHPTGEGS